jgi:hypothetical protein
MPSSTRATDAVLRDNIVKYHPTRLHSSVSSLGRWVN